MKKRGFILFLTCVLLGLLPTAAPAVEQHGDLIVQTDDLNCYTVTAESTGSALYDFVIHTNASIRLSGNGSNYHIIVEQNAQNVSITLDNFTTIRPTNDGWGHRNGITLQDGSAATVTLVGTNTVCGGLESSAIRVDETSSLTIDGDGILNASVDNGSCAAYSAVIGGQYTQSCGNITINGGTINAVSKSSNAAAIGSSFWNNSEGTNNGTITLNGGVINANSIGGINNSNTVVTGSGNAVVNTNMSRLKVNLDTFNGIVWDGDNGTVYGHVAAETLAVDNGKILTIPDGAALTIPSGGQMTIEGAVILGGTLENNGAVAGSGEIIAEGGSMSGGGTSAIAPAPCSHRNTNFIFIDTESHKEVCTVCGQVLGTEPHTGVYTCDKCNYPAVKIGDHAYAVFDEGTGTLNIYGSGNLYGERELYGSDIYEKWRDIRSATRSIVINDGIMGIGDHLFYGFRQLEEVSLPVSLTKIGRLAFDSCHDLKAVIIPEHVTEVDHAFYYCTGLEIIIVPEGLNPDVELRTSKVEYQVENNEVSITKITLGDGRTSVDIPAEISGKPVTKIAEDCLPNVGNHYHAGAPCGGSGICTICGTPYTRPHTLMTDSAVVATCTVAGKTEGSHCAVCHAVLTAQSVIPALGHDWRDWTVVTAATSTTAGSRERVCKRCSEKETESIAPSGGNAPFIYLPAKPAAREWVNPFPDVAGDAWYYDSVRFVCENGLMDGYAQGAFGPNDELSRAQLTQILYNKAGRPDLSDEILGYPFSDVPGNTWFSDAVYWTRLHDIADGYSREQFGPHDPISREQLAVMLWRYAGRPASPNPIPDFSDSDSVSGFAQDALRWAVDQGIITGKGGGVLDPQGRATRAEVAAMLMRFSESKK